jgi:hypothetical protein
MNLSDLFTNQATRFGDRKFLFFERQPDSDAKTHEVALLDE